MGKGRGNCFSVWNSYHHRCKNSV